MDGIFAPITANSIPFFKQASDLELTMPIMTAGGALDYDVILAAPKATEGRYVTDTFLDHSRGAAATMLELYQSKFNKLPNYPSVTGRGYDGLLTVIQALENAKSFTSEDIKDALYKVDFEGAGYHVQISEQGGARLPVEVLEVKDGLLQKR